MTTDHLAKAKRLLEQAHDEMNHGHYDTAQTLAILATSHATIAFGVAAGAPARPVAKRDPAECQYKGNHPYMSEPCPLCGHENGAPL